METQVLPRVNFRQVHADLELEHVFLKGANTDRDKKFSERSEFLRGIGFEDSIATRLYDKLKNSGDLFKKYDRAYLGRYKFIVEPQLERLCEKYNLFVRQFEFFMGDIPEKNIADMEKFKVRLCDVVKTDMLLSNGWGDSKETVGDYVLKEMGKQVFTSLHTDTMENPNDKTPLTIRDIVDYRNSSREGLQIFKDTFQIAAVESLFNPKAFEETKSRIVGREELFPKMQVDLDPIVLCKTLDGYLIITAWGDEANDELVANHNNN